LRGGLAERDGHKLVAAVEEQREQPLPQFAVAIACEVPHDVDQKRIPRLERLFQRFDFRLGERRAGRRRRRSGDPGVGEFERDRDDDVA
jgi:hypothetical protein